MVIVFIFKYPNSAYRYYNKLKNVLAEYCQKNSIPHNVFKFFNYVMKVVVRRRNLRHINLKAPLNELLKEINLYKNEKQKNEVVHKKKMVRANVIE